MNEKEIFENSNSTVFTNIKTLNEWFNPKDFNRSVFDDQHLILTNNKNIFTEKYGKQAFCTSDSQRRRLHVWKFIVNEDTTLWVITAPERGTSIEVEIRSDKEKNLIDIKEKIREIFELEYL